MVTLAGRSDACVRFKLSFNNLESPADNARVHWVGVTGAGGLGVLVVYLRYRRRRVGGQRRYSVRLSLGRVFGEALSVLGGYHRMDTRLRVTVVDRSDNAFITVPRFNVVLIDSSVYFGWNDGESFVV